jgi:hypothetical protein
MDDLEILFCWQRYQQGWHISDIAYARLITRLHVQWAIDEAKRRLARDGAILRAA